jgi:two-component system, OmpR family, response regulator CpxR
VRGALETSGDKIRTGCVSTHWTVPTAGKILLVDDDAALCELVADVLSTVGFRLESAFDGGRGLARAIQEHFDLVLLDVMLPVLDGFEVLRQLRRRSPVPVIMLTARNSQQDRVAGLNAGADDYLAKPFGTEELLARVRAVLRRTGSVVSGKADVATVGNLLINRVGGKVSSGDQVLAITATEFAILELLVSSAGRVVTRDEVCAVLYQRPATPFERSLEVHVSHLRKKLGGTGILIRPVRGVGYLLTEEGE